jgi:hypothetical protein
MTRRAAVAFFVVFFVCRSGAAQTAESVAVYSPGAAPCSTWLEGFANREDPKDIRLKQFDAYLHGFATAYNVYAFNEPNATDDILKTSDLARMHAYLENYCRTSPVEIYYKAVRALLDDLRAQHALTLRQQRGTPRSSRASRR